MSNFDKRTKSASQELAYDEKMRKLTGSKSKNEIIDFLDWIVKMDLAHYSTEQDKDYKPSGPSHFYIKRSLERFTSDELFEIYFNEAPPDLHIKWLNAIADSKR